MKRRILPQSDRWFVLIGVTVTVMFLAGLALRVEETREVVTERVCTTVNSPACLTQALIIAETCLRDDRCAALVTATAKRGKGLPSPDGKGSTADRARGVVPGALKALLGGGDAIGSPKQQGNGLPGRLSWPPAPLEILIGRLDHA